MNANIIILLILLSIPLSIQLSISGSNDTDVYSKHFEEEFGREFMEDVFSTKETKTTEPSSVGGSSRDIFTSGETPPIKIISNFIKPRRDGDFFKDEEIEVLVKIITQKEGGLNQMEFWEIPDEDLNITYCSHQIRTSNIQQMLDYEEQNSSFLKESDILNVTAIMKLLSNESSNQIARQKLDNYIYKELSNDTKELLIDIRKDNFNENLQYKFSQYLSNDFNEIIENDSTDLLMLFNKCNIKIDRKRVSSLNPNSSAYHDSKDYRLQKRQMLEHIYPKMLKNLSFIKEHESQNLVANLNAIRIIEKNLRQGESIIFKYYLRPTDLGIKEIRYMLRADGYLQEDCVTIKVSERGEKFSIDYRCDSKSLTRLVEKKFVYNIEYLGGNDETNSFPVNIIPPDGCRIARASWEDPNKPKFDNETWLSIDNVSFSKGKAEKLSITAVFSETGLRKSPPWISIGSYNKEFETDLAVYEDYDEPAKVHYEIYSLVLTILTLIISGTLIYYTRKEIKLTREDIELTRKAIEIAYDEIKLAREQMDQARIDRKDSDALIASNIKMLEMLKRTINKLLGD
jgi:hypothetical protein